jgi:hypothetical protein
MYPVDAFVRRGLLLGGLALPAGFVLARSGAVNVAAEAIRHFENVAARLTDSYAYTSPAATAGAVRAELPVVRTLLSEGSLNAAGRARLHAAAGRLTALLANAMLDTGWTGQALRTLDAALVHAEAGGDATGQAWVRLLQACAEQADGDPATALVYARRGSAVAPGGSPVAARLAAEGVAISLAQLGDRSGSARALDAAWRMVEAFTPSQRGVPGWHPEHLHPGELDSITAAAYVYAGNPGAALIHTETGVVRLDGSPATGHRSYVRVNAADALLAIGHVERAVVCIREALEISEDRKLSGIGESARRFVCRARTTTPGPLVDDLDSYIRHWHVTAPVRATA